MNWTGTLRPRRSLVVLAATLAVAGISGCGGDGGGGESANVSADPLAAEALAATAPESPRDLAKPPKGFREVSMFIGFTGDEEYRFAIPKAWLLVPQDEGQAKSFAKKNPGLAPLVKRISDSFDVITAAADPQAPQQQSLAITYTVEDLDLPASGAADAAFLRGAVKHPDLEGAKTTALDVVDTASGPAIRHTYTLNGRSWLRYSVPVESEDDFRMILTIDVGKAGAKVDAFDPIGTTFRAIATA